MIQTMYCKLNIKELCLKIFSIIMGCWPQATWFLWFRKVQLLTNWCISAAAVAEKDNISSRGGGGSGSYKFDTKDPRWMDFLNQGLGSWYPPPPQSNCKKISAVKITGYSLPVLNRWQFGTELCFTHREHCSLVFGGSQRHSLHSSL